MKKNREVGERRGKKDEPGEIMAVEWRRGPCLPYFPVGKTTRGGRRKGNDDLATM